MLSERTEILKSFDGNDIFFRCFTPKRRDSRHVKVDGLVLAVHGFGEHSGRYAQLANEICEKNLAFACFDLRGHGKSGPRRGDAENLHALVLDVMFVINHARGILGLSRRSDSFFGLFGHSFGGTLVTYAASVLRDICPPVFLSSPCYKMKQKLPAWKKIAALSLTRVAPVVHLPVQILPELLSQNPENNAAWAADELNLSSVSARMGEIFLEAVDDNRIRHAISLVHAPLTIVCGTEDKLVDVERVKDIFPLFASHQTALHFIEGAGHEIFNEQEELRKQALSFLMDWIDRKGLTT